MMIFFNLISEGFSCLFYGVLITAFIMATLYFVLKTLSQGAVRSVAFYITGPVMGLLLIANMTIMAGAFAVKAQTESMQIWLAQRLDGVYGIADVQSSQQVGDMLNEEFPLSGCFLNLFDFSGHPMDELPQVFYEVINDEMNGVIWSRVLWSAGIIVAAVLIALYFDKGKGSGSRKKAQGKRRPAAARKNFDDF